eukprot:gene9149-11215_t
MVLCVGSFFEPFIPTNIGSATGTDSSNQQQQQQTLPILDSNSDIKLPQELLPYKNGDQTVPIPTYFMSFTQNDAHYIDKLTDSTTGELFLPNIKNPFKKGMDPIKDLTMALNPAYHFSKDSFYFQRPPYFNGSTLTTVTRFLSLAPVNNEKKEKFIFAMNYQPSKPVNTEGATQNPFQRSQQQQQAMKKQRTTIDGDSQNFFFGDNVNNQQQQGGNRRNQQQQHQQRKRQYEETKCWFCLSSPDVESHLVVTIGSEAYLAFPKGGIVDHHLLIVFIEHKPSYVSLEDQEKQDVDKFISSLKSYFDQHGKDIVVFERNVPLKGVVNHGHLQVVPIPKNISPKVLDSFKEHGEKLNITFEEINQNDISQTLKEKPYFLIFLPDGKKYYANLPNPFDYQFGRKVFVDLLNTPEKLNWKDCVLGKDKETQVTKDFRKQFESFYQPENDDEDEDEDE